MIKHLKPRPYGTGRDDLLIETPENGLIKSNILIDRIKKKIVIDSGMEEVLRLFWDNNIQTHGCCYGHEEDSFKEPISWIDVSEQDFKRACELDKEIFFNKPLGIVCSSINIIFFKRKDYVKLCDYSLFPYFSYLLVVSE